MVSRSNIVFVHPDLGVGGAERLVVDAAICLKESGHKVSFITSHHSTSHCFEETKDFPVVVVGDWLPRHIFGRLFALCAYIRMIYCSLYIILFLKPDLVFCDLVSVCIPILHLSVDKVVFYCHYPDQLLSKKGNWLKDLYRMPLNWVEEATTNCADKLFVNSGFTRDVFKRTFKTIKKNPEILYPSIHTDSFDKVKNCTADFLQPPLPDSAVVFLSINRYERKKNISLAIHSLKKLKELISSDLWTRLRLVIVGGYDERVTENKEYYKELKVIAAKSDLLDKIYFLKSPSDVEKVTLLKACDCVIYTPPNEHFGIVPLEAMYCRKPVIAVNSGGPTETVLHNETGILCDCHEDSFSTAMFTVLQNNTAKKMGEAGYNRFCEKFSFDAFSKHLNSEITKLLAK